MAKRRGRPPKMQAGTRRTVQLESGGRLVLSADVDLLNLSPRDRRFVFDLIDAMGAYEKTGRHKETVKATAQAEVAAEEEPRQDPPAPTVLPQNGMTLEQIEASLRAQEGRFT